MKSETSPAIMVNLCDPEQELKFVDPDIAEACRKMEGYLIGTPTQMQLTRNLRELLEFLKEEVKHDGT